MLTVRESPAAQDAVDDACEKWARTEDAWEALKPPHRHPSDRRRPSASVYDGGAMGVGDANNNGSISN
jgi:hypothetical protein